MARAHQALTVDESVGDPAAVVRAFIGNHHQPPAAQSRDRDPPGTDARGQHGPGRQLTHQPAPPGARCPKELRQAIVRSIQRSIRVVAELVEAPGGQRGHGATLRPRSDSTSAWPAASYASPRARWLYAPRHASWRRQWSARTRASMASTIGTARGSTHGSWRPRGSRTVGLPAGSTVGCGCRIVAVGLNAIRTVTGSPLEMPPWMPPERLVRVPIVPSSRR